MKVFINFKTDLHTLIKACGGQGVLGCKFSTLKLPEAHLELLRSGSIPLFWSQCGGNCFPRTDYFAFFAWQTTVSWDGDKLQCVQKGEKEGRGWTQWIEGDELHLVGSMVGTRTVLPPEVLIPCRSDGCWERSGKALVLL